MRSACGEPDDEQRKDGAELHRGDCERYPDKEAVVVSCIARRLGRVMWLGTCRSVFHWLAGGDDVVQRFCHSWREPWDLLLVPVFSYQYDLRWMPVAGGQTHPRSKTVNKSDIASFS